MKKTLLLLAAMLAAVSINAAETLFIYDYNNWPSDSVSFGEIITGQAPTWYESLWSDTTGLMTLSSTGVVGNSEQEYWQKGTQIVDLGGTVGRVLCISASGSDINTLLKAWNADLDDDFITCACTTRWGNIGWYLSEALTPDSSTSYDATTVSDASELIHVKLVFNYYEKDKATTEGTEGIGRIAGVNGANIYSPKLGDYNTAITGEEFVDADGNWDPSIWMTYEFNGWAKTKPYNAQIYKHNTGADWTLFVKSVEYSTMDEIPEVVTGATITIDSTYTINPGSSAGIALIESEAKADTAVDVYNINGTVVRHAVLPAEATAGLEPGFYIVGRKKVIVK